MVEIEGSESLVHTVCDCGPARPVSVRRQRASDVIVRLRSLLNKTPFELREIDLNEVVRDTLDLLSALATGQWSIVWVGLPLV
jgi:hypothetical protein